MFQGQVRFVFDAPIDGQSWTVTKATLVRSLIDGIKKDADFFRRAESASIGWAAKIKIK